MYLLHDGVLKPLEALGLREQQRVRITVEEVERAAPPSAASREAARERFLAGARKSRFKSTGLQDLQQMHPLVTRHLPSCTGPDA